MPAAAGRAEVAGAAGTPCARVSGAGRAAVSGPGKEGAWRAGLDGSTAVFATTPAGRPRVTGRLARTDAPWLMVIARPHAADGRCWLEVRLPWRPNDAAGWIDADRVFLAQTRWRIGISTSRRTLTLFRDGEPVRTVSVVVGKPSTPTPTGLFAVAWAIRWKPNDFLGSWVLELTAHSDVLRRFDGGDGTVGIHGRGGSSLLDPLGSAASHGCIRLANAAIDWLVRTVGSDQLPGTPVRIS